MNVAIVIPARLNSTRLKEKMLIKFDDEPLIRIVFDKCRLMGYDTYVVTDSKKIAQHITIGNVIMTGEAENGTARIASVVDQLEKYDLIVNIQGDMLDITRDTIQPIIDNCHSGYITTAYKKGYVSNGVKIIHQNGYACWFTRSNIGYGDSHLGIYAYTPFLLKRYEEYKDKYPIENLEQNRLLGSPYKIRAVEVKYDGKEINTEQDLF